MAEREIIAVATDSTGRTYTLETGETDTIIRDGKKVPRGDAIFDVYYYADYAPAGAVWSSGLTKISGLAYLAGLGDVHIRRPADSKPAGFFHRLPQDIGAVVLGDVLYSLQADGNFSDGTDSLSPDTVAAMLRRQRETEPAEPACDCAYCAAGDHCENCDCDTCISAHWFAGNRS